MKTFKEFIGEDGIAANSVSGGQIAGTGIGSSGEPGVDNKKKKSPVLGRIRRIPPDAQQKT